MLATLIRLLGDFDLAEEALHDAFAAALQQWPASGVPKNPRTWLVSAGRFKSIDQARRRARHDAGHDAIVERARAAQCTAARRRRRVARRRLAATHLHLLSPRAERRRADRAHAARGVRPDDGAGRARIPVDATDDRAAHRSREGEDPRCRDSVRNSDARRHARSPRRRACTSSTWCSTKAMPRPRATSSCAATSRARRSDWRGCCSTCFPTKARSAALLALMLLHDSRRETRATPEGDLVLLAEQDRARWDHGEIDGRLELVRRALRAQRYGSYAVQAAIAALHAQAPSAEETDWAEIAGLYDVLLEIDASPVVELNRAVAVAMRDGAAAGLALVDAIVARGALSELPPRARGASGSAGTTRPARCGGRRLRARAHARGAGAGAALPRATDRRIARSRGVGLSAVCFDDTTILVSSGLHLQWESDHAARDSCSLSRRCQW